MSGPAVLIVGGSGLAGGYIASALLDSPEASVVLGARDARRLERAAAELASKYGTDRIATVVVDASDPDSLKRAAVGAQLVVLAAQAKQHGAAIGRAALDAGADVIDITLSTGEHHPMGPLRAEAAAAGHCLVTDAGLVPGLPSLLVRLAAGRLDRLDTAFVGITSSNKDGWPDNTVAELVADLAHPPTFVWRDGAWRRSRLLGMADRRKFDFGPGWGKRTCGPVLVEEMRELPGLFPSLQQAGTFIANNAFVDSVALPVAMILTRLAPRRGQRPATRLVGWGMRRFARAPFGGVLKVEASGERSGAPKDISVTVSHPNEYQATGLVLAAFVAQWVDGPATPARTPGLHPMGTIVEPERFMQDLAASGFIVS
ncbi:MAG: saccharopine dehydrogenase NADP-binding domain-containing protein [Actinomycetota bacterium]|nr:saccharopine dehydrogenase NADP-binding domain-containing protein [Actinomycetota bacterium]